MAQPSVVAAHDNISTMDEVFLTVLCLRRLAPTIVGTRIHTEQLSRRLWFSSSPLLSASEK